MDNGQFSGKSPCLREKKRKLRKFHRDRDIRHDYIRKKSMIRLSRKSGRNINRDDFPAESGNRINQPDSQSGRVPHRAGNTSSEQCINNDSPLIKKHSRPNLCSGRFLDYPVFTHHIPADIRRQTVQIGPAVRGKVFWREDIQHRNPARRAESAGQ